MPVILEKRPSRYDELVAGDHMSVQEFLRRWQGMAEVKRAELIDGRVYMPSPVGLDHSDPHFDAIFCAAYYCARAPQCHGGDNATTLMSESDAPQPDVFLRLKDERVGTSRAGKKYLEGAPELIIEISLTTHSYDSYEKKDLYARAGVKEYVQVLVESGEVRWFVLKRKSYESLPISPDGIYRSVTFPGFWIDPKALLNGDKKRLLQVLDLGMKSPEFVKFAARKTAS